ncbi:MAG TPA: tetratricopeptide repeat protein [Roseococcus sp.]|nr:tetratricopeptide repeat protein [Roseococcus sp.]
MPDLVDEVDEELRAERAKRLAMRYGSLLAGALLLALAGVAGWQGWRWYENRQAGQAAAQFLAVAQEAAAEGADMRAAAQRFSAIAAEAPAGYRTLARLRAAALLAETGQRDEALAAYNALAADGGADSLYRDLATVLWGLHAVDVADAGEITARLTPLAGEAAPWRASAREVLALVALRAGRNAEARGHLQALLADAATPPGIRERANRLMQGTGS